MNKWKKLIYIGLFFVLILGAGQGQVKAKEAVDDDPGRERLTGETPVDFYDSSKISSLSLENVPQGANPYTGKVYTHKTSLANGKILYGIDVSKYQTNINWTSVKADGIDFAFIRAGYRGYGTSGTLTEDTYYEQNMKNASAAGVKLGTYIFSQATTTAEAQEEADYICGLAKGYDVTMPIVLDFEYASVNGSNGGRLYDAKMTKAEATAVCNAFCARVKSLGYTPMIYANPDMLQNQLDASAISKNYKIWLANYTTKTDYAGDYEYWQYSSTGKIDGITGNVDCNFWYEEEESSQVATPNAVKPAITSKKVSRLSKKASTTTSLTVSWTKLSGAEGYEVYRANALDGTYSKVKTISSGTTVSYKQTGLTSARQYYYKVRAYTTVDSKKYYSSCSSVLAAYTQSSYTRKAVTKTSLNMRKTASASAALIKTVSKGTTLSVISFTYSKNGSIWYRVKYTAGGKAYSGYMRGTYLNIYKYGKTKSSVNMRSNAGTSYKVVCSLSKGAKVTIVSSKKASNGAVWYSVKYTKNRKTYKGYINSTYIQLV